MKMFQNTWKSEQTTWKYRQNWRPTCEESQDFFLEIIPK